MPHRPLRAPAATATIVAVLAFVSLARAADKPEVRFNFIGQKPSNILPADKPVNLKAQIGCSAAGEGKAELKVIDYGGREVWTKTLPFKPNGPGSVDVPLNIGKLDAGYFELRTAVTFKSSDGQDVSFDHMASFGVARIVHRSAKEARAGNSRFGLKTWGADDLWWNRSITWKLGEVVDACASLGLQWTRHAFNEKGLTEAGKPARGLISTQDLLSKHAMNAVLKIEGFPADCYDAVRYGPMAEWEAKHGKGQWNRRTVPSKAKYVPWLKSELQKLPADQNVFEIWNEPWGKIKPEEFAELCQMILPVVRQVRPNAIVGPNTGLGPIQWELPFVKAGGLKGMDMVAIHPYSFTPPPERRTRAAIRNYHDFLKAYAGKDLDLYVTEFGWSTAPKAPKGVNEHQQAQRTVRQSLMFMAEDIKLIIPHWMGDREQDPADQDMWFGFFRLTGQPRPVVMAYANCARLIDGGKFVGDLDYGPGVGAMLFEKNGVHTLALWSLDEADGAGREIDVKTDAPQVTVSDIMGTEHSAACLGNTLKMRVSSDMTYLIGVGASLATSAVKPDADMSIDRWTTRAVAPTGPQTAAAFKRPPRIDGKVEEWAGPWIELNAANAQGVATHAAVQAAWDKDNLYLAVRAKSDAPPAGQFELRLSTRPSRQLELSGWAWYDYTLTLAPAGPNKPPTLTLANDQWPTPKTVAMTADPTGVRWAWSKTSDGWSGEIALSAKAFAGRPWQDGAALTWLPQFIADTEGGPTRLSASAAESPLEWPVLRLAPTP